MQRDGSLMAAVDDAGDIVVYDLRTMRVSKRLKRSSAFISLYRIGHICAVSFLSIVCSRHHTNICSCVSFRTGKPSELVTGALGNLHQDAFLRPETGSRDVRRAADRSAGRVHACGGKALRQEGGAAVNEKGGASFRDKGVVLSLLIMLETRHPGHLPHRTRHARARGDSTCATSPTYSSHVGIWEEYAALRKQSSISIWFAVQAEQ
jgi:hypothetical protein